MGPKKNKPKGKKAEQEEDKAAPASAADGGDKSPKSTSEVISGVLGSLTLTPPSAIGAFGDSGQPPAETAAALVPELTFTSSIGNVRPGEYEIPRVKNVDERKKNCGTEGRPIVIKTNHFEMKIKCPSVYQYDVKITAPWKRENRRSDEPLFCRAFEKLKITFRGKFTDHFAVIFDGRSNAFSTKELPFKDNSFKGEVELREVPDIDRNIKLIFEMKRAGVIEVAAPIEKYCYEGSTSSRGSSAAESIRLINTLFLHIARVNQNRICVGRSVFSQQKGDILEIGGGKSLWIGLFTSFRPAWKPFLNADMANKPGYEETPTISFFKKVLPGVHLDKLNKREWEELSLAVKGLKIRFVRPDGHLRDYRANGLGPNSNEPVVVKESKKEKLTVEQYFLDEYKAKLLSPGLPTLHVGNREKDIYLPLEYTKIKKQPCPNSKKLTDVETAQMIKSTAVRPDVRQRKILDELRDMNDNFKQDPYARAYGITIADQFTKIKARVLTPPSLTYNLPKQSSNSAVLQEPFTKTVRDGKWDMDGPSKGQPLTFITGKSLNYWGVLNLCDRLHKDRPQVFVKALYEEARSRGLKIDFPIYANALPNLRDAEKKFLALLQQIRDKYKEEPQLIMIFVECKGPIYGCIKHLGDIIYNIPTQFVLQKTVLRNKKGSYDPDPMTLHNICLKLNSKLGGVNQVLDKSCRPALMRRPVMLMGADVTHPSPDQMGQKPSIAAMVASVDPNAAIYYCEVRLQEGGQVVEEILDTQDMTKRLLMEFYKWNKCRKPEKIIIFRDGVSEGQFRIVLAKELSAIRRACLELEKDYQPGITFMVAQKRHKTRLFPDNPRDGGRSGNVPPGTVVDTDITNPTEESFFLASHEGIQGTTRPTGYHKLWDDNKLPPDETQKVTFYLCHLYSRCERSVSYPAPTYYAHLAAFRAREHHNALMAKGLADNAAELEKLKHPSLFDYFI